MWAVLAQVVAPIGIMAVGAHYFVQSVEHISQEIGVPAGRSGVLHGLFWHVPHNGDFYANTFVTPTLAISVPEALDVHNAGVLTFWLPTLSW